MHGVYVCVGARPHAGRTPPAPHPGPSPPLAVGVSRGGCPGAQRGPCRCGSGETPLLRSPPPPPGRSPPAAPPAATHHLKPPRCRVRSGGAGPRRVVTASPGWRRCPTGRGNTGGHRLASPEWAEGGHTPFPGRASVSTVNPGLPRSKGGVWRGTASLAPRGPAGRLAPPSPTTPCPWGKHTQRAPSPAARPALAALD